MRRNGAGTRLAAKVGAKVGLRGGGKLLPVIGEALMAYDAGSETYRLVKERRRGKKRGLGESAARVAGAAFIGGEGVDWAEGKLRKRKNPSCARCGGKGHLPEFSHVEGGRCFACRVGKHGRTGS